MLKVKDARRAQAVHEVEVFGPAATIVPYRDEQDACALIARGGGSLVASVYGEDKDLLARMVSEIGPGHGRILAVDPAIAAAHTGHGIVMPQCNHGGPGRAGAGEELGGLHGLRFYHQRLAVQGSSDLLARLQAKAAQACIDQRHACRVELRVWGTDQRPHTAECIPCRHRKKERPTASSNATDCGATSNSRRRPKPTSGSRSTRIEVVRLSFPDQHGILRGKTVMASEAGAVMRNGCSITTTLLAKDTSHKTVFPVFTAGGGFGMAEMEGAGDFLMIADPTTFRVLPWAPHDRLDAVRHVFRRRPAGAVLDPPSLSAARCASSPRPGSTTWPASRSSSTCSSSTIRD